MLLETFVSWCQDNNCGLYSLVHIALSVRRGQHHRAWQSFFGEAVDAVVVAFVVHPVFKLFFIWPIFEHLVHWKKLHLYWRVAQHHVQLKLDNCTSKSQEILRIDVFVQQLKITFFKNKNRPFPKSVLDEPSDLSVTKVKNDLALIFENWLQTRVEILHYLALSWFPKNYFSNLIELLGSCFTD